MGCRGDIITKKEDIIIIFFENDKHSADDSFIRKLFWMNEIRIKGCSTRIKRSEIISNNLKGELDNVIPKFKIFKNINDNICRKINLKYGFKIAEFSDITDQLRTTVLKNDFFFMIQDVTMRKDLLYLLQIFY